jgi:hypothetical protein
VHHYGEAGDISNVPYQGAGTYVSTGSDVALRSEPVKSDPAFGPAPSLIGGGSNVIELVQKGDVLDGTATDQNGFAFVTHRMTGKQGWMSEMYLYPRDVDPAALALPQNVPVMPVQPAPGPQPEPAPEPAPGPSKTGAGAVVLGLLLIVVVGYGLAK